MRQGSGSRLSRIVIRATRTFQESYNLTTKNLTSYTMAANGVSDGATPSDATDAVLKPSDPVPEGAVQVEGLDFSHFADRNISAAELVEKMCTMGFQASSIGQAAKIIDGMVGRGLLSFPISSLSSSRHIY